MQFNGFQKMTLLDYPGKVACTLFTAGCNFRCPFCHNAPLVTGGTDETYSEEEILAFLQKRRGLLDGVAVTGGEPLMHAMLPNFLRKVKELGFLVKLDTNGSFPERLSAVVSARLVDFVAMDVKNCRERYAETCGTQIDLSAVEASVRYLLSSGVDYEFRTTVVKEFHDVSAIRSLAEWIRGAKAYYLQNFEDSGNLLCDGLSPLPKETLFEMQRAAAEILPSVSLRGV